MSFLGDFWCTVRVLVHVYCPKVSDIFDFFAMFFEFFIQREASTPGLIDLIGSVGFGGDWL
jgi:hypothetical protein